MSEQRPKDAEDLNPTIPAKGWDGAATVPITHSKNADVGLPAKDGSNLNKEKNTSGTMATLPIAYHPLAETITDQVDNLAATRATVPAGQAETLRAGTALPENSPTSSQSRTGSALTSEHARTGTVSRTVRTRINLNLPADAQLLDRKLQTSRTSVLADMATARLSRGTGAIPKGLQRLIEQQGTEGRYAIDRPLAAGGMGAVLKIEDHDFRRGAAMKVIHARFADQPEALERFLAEAQITAQLEHPNIVPIHDLGTMEDGTLYYTMKLIEGRSLNALIKQLMQGRGLLKDSKGVLIAADADALAAVQQWTINERILVFLKVLDGVGYANSHGVVHRDIKPDNIMLGPHGEVLVVDWGIAKVLPGAVATAIQAGDGKVGRQVVSLREADALSATLEGQAMGTIFYMPPEQATGNLAAIDARSDVYALGATLYELLALRRCLNSSSLPDMVMQVAAGGWIAFDQAWEQTQPGSKADPDLTAIIHQAMAHDPAKRYSSCEAFAADLRRFIAGQGVLARRRNLIERIGLWYAAHRRQVQVGVGVVVIATVAVMAGTWIGSREQRALAISSAAEARRFAETAGEDVHLLQDAAAKLQAAVTLNPDDTDLRYVQERLLTTLGKAEQRADAQKVAEGQRIAITAKIAELRQSAKLFQEAATRENQPAKSKSALEDAERVLTSAIELNPKDGELDQQREQVRSLLRDERKRIELLAKQDARHQAQLALEKAEQQLALVTAVPNDISALTMITDQLKNLETHLQKADGLDGMQDLVKRSDRLRAELEQRRALLTRRDQAQQLKTRAAKALQNGHIADAEQVVRQALDTAPDHVEALPLRRELQEQLTSIIDIKRRNEEITRRQVRAQEAEQKLSSARITMKALADASKRATTAQTLAAKLNRELATEPATRKEPLFAARRTTQNANLEAAQKWADSEAAAQNALALVADQADSTSAAAANELLADLYVLRLRDARTKGNLAEMLASRSQLMRYDITGRYRSEIAGQGTLIIAAPAGTNFTLHALRDTGDGRLIASGDPLTIVAGQPLTVDAGSYRIEFGQNEIACAVAVNEQMTITIPPVLPAIPSHTLRLVSVPSELAKSFMLGQDEVTVEQYRAFINDPAILAQVKASWQRLTKRGDDADEAREPLLYIPRAVPSAYEPLSLTWQLLPYASHIESIEPQRNVAGITIEAGIPITGISRSDAEGFCAWLSMKTGNRVRLPTAAERAWATIGGDPARIHPWGPGFDRAFCVNAFSGANRAARPGSNTYDVGPFGHLDLAGNVREWLLDRPTDKDDLFSAGTKGALVAGGSWADESDFLFRSTASESIDDTFVSPIFGFRILVELP
jgi:serine/threonine protein kinase/formylglycine-generating enzyme required for sulfatase activity